MKTTLSKLKPYCRRDVWDQLYPFGDDIRFSQIIHRIGLEDSLWLLRAVDGYDKELRLFGVWCIRQISSLPRDITIVKALDVAEKFALGNATAQELGDAWAAARAVSPPGVPDAWGLLVNPCGKVARHIAHAGAVAFNCAWTAVNTLKQELRGSAEKEHRVFEMTRLIESQKTKLLELCNALEVI